MKKLPVGVQDFVKMRDDNFVYVDKTELIYNLLEQPVGLYFLSRPRRFGKSLMVSTLQCLFEGRRDLFKGLWIDQNTDWAWDKHPVIKIDFNRIKNENHEILEASIIKMLTGIVEEHALGLGDSSNDIPRYFGDIIIALRRKYDKDVVVLIDEYDKPIINHLGKGEEGLAIAAKNRDVLKQLFGVLKGQDVAGLIRFVFITGITKFARVSIFSDLNNLSDLSMSRKYATLLGYTEDELEACFKPYIEALADECDLSYDLCKKQLQDWYNGYRFTDKNNKVYNPFSILNVLQKQEFKNYWFESATPTFLLNVINERDYPVVNLDDLHITEMSFTLFEIENLSLEPLLFQTGYITIKGRDDQLYALGYPNREVRLSFINYLYKSLVNIEDSGIRDRFVLLQTYLKAHDMDMFIKTVDLILSTIPYVHIAKQNEHYFHTIFYLMLAGSGADVRTEVLSRLGRLDLAVTVKDSVYIIELKCDKSADDAITQIKEKRYADKYKAAGKTVFIMGINVNTESRGIDDWKIETV